MSSPITKILSRLYQVKTGVNPNYLRKIHSDAVGSLTALDSMVALQGYSLPVSPWNEKYASIETNQDTQELAHLFEKYGSDKSTKHNYHLIYADVLNGKRNDALSIWEIGIGTNDPQHPSSMGVDGSPGASLRAFRDFAPNAHVYGSDNDRGILFTEERIITNFVDQTVPETFTDLALSMPLEKGFDLIIDDGLHTSWANLNTVNFALTHLKPGGSLVVEDILEPYLPWWRVAGELLSRNFTCELVRMKAEMVFIIRKRDN